MASPPPSSVPRARIGRYALYGAIASGGMARVHIGRLLSESGFEKTVAIKRLHPQLAEDPGFIDGLLDEARIVSRIVHPSVVPMADVVRDGEEVWLVMEYVPGESLGRLVLRSSDRGERVPVRVATAIVVSVLHGLHAAHEARDEQGEMLGIVHRDVSPQNVLVGSDGLARLLDFGVAKARGRLTTTGAGQVKGKISYMSPEQLLAEEVDARTDVYAAGVVLWEALTGERMFRADDEGGLIGRVLDGKTHPPSEHRPDLPPALDEIVMRALERSPERRFASAHEMAVMIEERVGVATTRQVSEWAHSIAREDLDKRAALVAGVERLSEGLSPMADRGRSSSSRIPEIATAAPDAATLPDAVADIGSADSTTSGSQVSSISVSTAKPVVIRSNRLRTGALLVLALTLGGLSAVWLDASTNAEDASRAPAPPSVAGLPRSDATPAIAASPDSPASEPIPAPPVEASPPQAASAPAPSDLPAAGPAAPKLTSPPPVWTAKTTEPLDCTPPYTIGADGIRRLKKGCQ